MEEDGTEPQPGIIVGQDSSMTKTGEDGGGWHRTQPGIIVGQDSSYDKDGRRWRRMAQNHGITVEFYQEKMEEDGTVTWHQVG